MPKHDKNYKFQLHPSWFWNVKIGRLPKCRASGYPFGLPLNNKVNTGNNSNNTPPVPNPSVLAEGAANAFPLARRQEAALNLKSFSSLSPANSKSLPGRWRIANLKMAKQPFGPKMGICSWGPFGGHRSGGDSCPPTTVEGLPS